MSGRRVEKVAIKRWHILVIVLIVVIIGCSRLLDCFRIVICIPTVVAKMMA